nr:cupredoxin domain-containing protein [Actinomycetota bacterium]
MALRVAAAAAAGVLFVAGIALHDVETIAIAALMVCGSLLLRVRSGLIGRVALVLLFLDVLAWMAPAAWSNAMHGGALSSLAVPLVLCALSIAGLAAAAGLPERSVEIGGLALLVIALVVAALPRHDSSVPAATKPGETPTEWVIALSAKGVEFAPSKLKATGPDIAVLFRNKDLFWHTFTIDKLSVNLRAPLGGKRVEHFTAPAGTYEFYCAIPGHKAAGMTGTLTV